MSFKRLDIEDVVLSSELITFPTWYTQKEGDTSDLDMQDAVLCPEQGFSIDYYKDYYSGYVPETGSEESAEETDPVFDPDHSKALFSMAYAKRPKDKIIDFTPTINYVRVEKETVYDEAELERDEEGHYIPIEGVTYYRRDEDTYIAVDLPLDDEETYYVEAEHYVVDPSKTYYTRDEETDTYSKVGEPVELEDDKEYYLREEIFPVVSPAEIVFGQYRSLVLGDEDSEFRFGNTRVDSTGEVYADSFIALSVDRARFREKLDPTTCRIEIADLVLAPDISANRRYMDAGRVFDLAEVVEGEGGTITYHYPDEEGSSAATSYGYFLPDIGVILFNTSNNCEFFTDPEVWVDDTEKIETFKDLIKSIKLRSQETVTSNFVFVRARNAEFNYSTNPSNITGSAGNIRHDVMINQPQAFITTVGLYNDANDLLAVAKLSRPLIKDFTKEALIRIKLDY